MNAKTTGILQALRIPTVLAGWPRSLFSPETALASRKLAFVEAEGSVKWEELEDACALAVRSFGLPADFIAIAKQVTQPG
ncbi:hypothetical protein [Brucella intermedia]|uniref:hypothetical protein n=1 Tax=Brucella intermedia TaxID=94625 RepID=UPI00124E6608|nr:hypothetical protein [Brucella intermedia]KAB2724323.1 hypothetical protein F9L02_21160 [Brucella intermedia]